MTYSIIGILASIIMPIINRDVLLPGQRSSAAPVQQNYRCFLLGVMAYYITDMLWGIPQTSSGHMKEISTVIEALSCQCYNYVLPAFYESTMKTKLSDSEEDVEMLDIVRDSTALSFAYFYSRALGGTSVCMADLPRNTKAGEVSSYVSANQTALEENLAILVEQYQQLQELVG